MRLRVFRHDFLLCAPLPPFPLQIVNVPARSADACLVQCFGVELAYSVFQQQGGHRSAVREDDFFPINTQAVIRDVLVCLVLLHNPCQEPLELFIR